MKLPLSLIKSFITLDIAPSRIAETLTLLGIEVDRVANETLSFAKVVVGEVLSVKKHPHAKNLSIAEVSDGTNTHTVVCGAPNCRAHMKTAFAPEGALITDKDGFQRRIEKTTIREVPSCGMLCSGSELHISEEADQILDLPQETPTGEDIAKLFWDPVFELSLTPNLGHCMSALGIARELSSALNIPLEEPDIVLNKSPIHKEIIVKDPKLASRYTCCLIEGVKVQNTPFWAKHQLEACGQKSINSVVDVANYIMMKTGQPLHAFDADLLEGKELFVTTLKEPEEFEGLDGETRSLPEGTLVIRDGKKTVAIAGIMGGANSAVSDSTKRALLEAACFDPSSIRNTSKKLGLRTESSQRFEKGVDPEGVLKALFEAASMIEGKVIGFEDLYEEMIEPKEIPYRVDRINQLLGTKLSETEVQEIFKRLQFTVKSKKVLIPSYRNDITQEIDLVEEVARLYGYNHIEKKEPSISISAIPSDPMFLFENQMRQKLVSLGFFETITCNLISPKLKALTDQIVPSSITTLAAQYAKTEEYSILRASLLPNLLEVLHNNLAKQNKSLSLFEVGHIHFMQEGNYFEMPMLAFLLTGKAMPHHFSTKTRDVDYFDLKGVVESVVSASFTPSKHLALHPTRQADIIVDQVAIGSLGQIHPEVLEEFSIKQPVFYAEIDLMALYKKQKRELIVSDLSTFPSSDRDWTIPLPKECPIDLIFEEIQLKKPPILEHAELIDLYHPEGSLQANATFRFRYRDPMKTVSFEEVEKAHEQIVESVTKLLAK